MVLPSQDFFKPTDSGISRLVEFFKNCKDLFEAGAGSGLLSAMLQDRGIKIQPLDIYPREVSYCSVLQLDATTFPYPAESWIIIARPCHGRFLEDLTEQARACKCAGILYIGLERNQEIDLEGTKFQPCQIIASTDDPLGEDDEIAWILKFKQPLRREIGVDTCIIADNVGSLGQTPEEEAWDNQDLFETILDWNLDVRLLTNSVHKIPEGTELVLYDFGGVGIDSLCDFNAHEIIRWAEDHPSSLVVITSSHTFSRYVEMALKELGIKLHNLMLMDYNHDRFGIPDWFLPKAYQGTKNADQD